ncbi:integrase [Flavobacterium album]|uniref:Integrase n=1 Tax=Flavobacterium album TaxID=2175091 RepID=A0A2S1R0V1_9FLAO|nr:site-specific integrase [Flavobacterium album]AWH86264.1 integrase [Flavobacterium album]
MKRIKVTLRKKAMSNGKLSLYLDFYPPYFNVHTGMYSRREFLRIHLIAKPKNQIDKITNIENLHTAELMCTKRQNEVNKEFIYTPFEIEQLRKTKAMESSFLKYFKKQADYREGPNKLIWDSSIAHFEIFSESREFRFKDINTDLAEDFKEYLLKAKSLRETGKRLSKNTALSYLNKFKATLRKAYKEQILASDVNAAVNSIPEEESMRNYLTLEEAQALSRTPCDKEIIKRVSLFSILTGLRYSDIQNLKWDNVTGYGEDCHIRFRQEKTEQPETMPISLQAYLLLGEAGEKGQPVFEGLQKWDVYRHLPLWVAQAGITKHITFHCFRHTYATLQLSLGTDIFTVSKMLGHKSIKTTQVYTKIVDEKKKEAAKRISLD